MPVYRLTCPGCHKQFKLNVANQTTLMTKIFKCPQCGFSVPFSVMMNKGKTSASLETHIAVGKQPIDGRTQIVGGETHVAVPHSKVNASLMVEKTGKRFNLQAGTYILGRDSQDSTATLRIAADPYMSRQHAQLVVGIINGKVTCHLSALKSSNPVYVNNLKLSTDSSVVLKNQDRILLGMTLLIYTQN